MKTLTIMAVLAAMFAFGTVNSEAGGFSVGYHYQPYGGCYPHYSYGGYYPYHYGGYYPYYRGYYSSTPHFSFRFGWGGHHYHGWGHRGGWGYRHCR